MKTYKLKKDLPLAKIGTIVRLEDTPVEPSIKLIFEVNKSEHPLCAIYEKELNEWLEEIPQKPKSVWNLKEGDDFYFIFNNSVRKNFITNYEPFRVLYLEEGNVFLTKEEAEQELKKRQAIQRIKKYCWENDIELVDKDFITNVGNTKNHIFYDIKEHKFFSGCFNYSMEYSTFYLKRKEDAEEIIDNCEEDLKIIFNV